jgi:TolB-like protein/lipopolysaccharide biosynthesis regulator YciM
VFRTAAVYIVSAWLIMQVADVLFPGWGLPDAAVNVLFVAAIVGFPLALVFGWFFDVTMHGIVRTPSLDQEDGDVPLSLQRSDYLVLAVLVLIGAVILYDATTDIIETPRVTESGQPGGTGVAAPEKLPDSIAVLPFAHVGEDPDNETFCVGVSEEILHKLSDFAELNVIGRTSSFAFKGSDYGIRRISSLLGVGYLLQGSCRKFGDRLRITAQLVDETGVQRWSEAFDRTLADIFAIQTEIADVVATMVVPQISPSHATRREPDLAAYQHFLSGRELFRRREVRVAREEIAKALELDPEFAEAHAEYAIVRAWGRPGPSDIESARQAIDTALSLRPGLPRALAARGLVLNQQPDPDYVAAESVLRAVLETEPNMVDAMNWLSTAVSQQGRHDEGLAYLERALRIDPIHGVIGGNVAWNLQRRGDVEGAEAILLRLIDLPNPTWSSIYALAELYLKTGRLVDENATYKRLALTGLVPDTGLATNYALLDLTDKARYWAERVERESLIAGWAIVTRPLVLSMGGRYEEAVEAYRENLAARGKTLSDLRPWLRYHMGQLQALAGDHVGAVATLALLLANSEPVKITNPGEAEALRALAWAYAQLGAREEAEQLLRALEDAGQQLREQGLANSSAALFRSAQTALQLGETDVALDRFEAAVRAGWRQYYRYHHHPVWAMLADNPRYQALMAEVKADVDRQRAEVERIDAEEDFPALLDKVRASRP